MTEPRTMRSAEINELAAALAKAQGAISNATMNRINPHFRSRYADLASVLDAIRKPLADNGLAPVQQIDALEGMVLRTTLMHSSGQWIASEYPLPAAGRPQEMGSALTYARRYSLSALVCTAADEDDDANAAESQGQKTGVRRAPPRPAPNPMVDAFGLPLVDPKTGEVLSQASPPTAPGATSSAAAGPSESHAPEEPAAAPPDAMDESNRLAGLDATLDEAAKGGTEKLKAAWNQLGKEDKATFKAALERRYKPMALEADERMVSSP